MKKNYEKSIDDLYGFTDICDSEKGIIASGEGCWSGSELTGKKFQEQMADEAARQKKAEVIVGTVCCKA